MTNLVAGGLIVAILVGIPGLAFGVRYLLNRYVLPIMDRRKKARLDAVRKRNPGATVERVHPTEIDVRINN